jgi:hypothetical protein
MQLKFLNKFGFKFIFPAIYTIFILVLIIWIKLIENKILPDGCDPSLWICISAPYALVMLSSYPAYFILLYVFGFQITYDRNFYSDLAICFVVSFLLCFLSGLLLDKIFLNRKWSVNDETKIN